MKFSNSSKYISSTLISWYNFNKRELPWRDINDPYKIWISEIILQQTRVNQGLSYYQKFIERFPTVIILAEANEEEVLKYWQGLGYYSRARNLHKAAQQIITAYNGIFPNKHNEVIKLAGIGEYTAAAICSFAYNQPYSVVDGNVYRVLSRLLGIETPIDSVIGKKQFASLAYELLDKSNPAIHNQAIMEFGAIQCVPVSPDCSTCCLKNNCKAYELNLISFLPIKSKKIKVTHRFFNYFFIEFEGQTYLQKRTEKDVWQHLYEFPLIELDHLLSTIEIYENEQVKNLFEGITDVQILKTTNPMKHVLTHRVIFAQFFTIKVSNENETIGKFLKVQLKDIEEYPVSRLMELFIESKQH
ncbi:MAG: A/G-specific adenine glycosylase [Paludibacter sp.]